jgi:hypothetical protein
MFVPLVQYHGGGDAATIEPLKEHLPHYGQRLANLFGAGVQACYRGPRLYDTEATKQLVTSTIAWYKKYRDILNAPIFHLRRADGRDWDGFMHVSPVLKDRAFVLLYNPTKENMVRKIRLPLYYAGLSGRVSVKEKDLTQKVLTTGKDDVLSLDVTIPAESYTWFVLRPS